MTNLTLDLATVNLTAEQYYQLCVRNKNVRFERNANGDLVIMPPTGGETGNRNGKIIQQLFNWSDEDETGIPFDNATGFTLPNGADRAPDAAWIPIEKWNELPPEQRQRFLPLCPDFVVELMSPSDSLKATQQKMQEYLDNGAKLGWLINRKTRRVEIYRPDREVEKLNNPSTLSGEDVLPGFVLKLSKIW
ncbi:MAG: Uma2 family endonuclease [Cyanobacteria bacterium P01_E01_bin.42]